METWLSFAGGVILLLLGATITKLTAISKQLTIIVTDLAVVKNEIHAGNVKFAEYEARIKDLENSRRTVENRLSIIEARSL